MKSLFFRLDSGQVFYLGNLITAKWTPATPAAAINPPPGNQAAVAARLQLHFLGGHVEALSGEDAQAVWEYLGHLSTKQLRADAAPAAERQP